MPNHVQMTHDGHTGSLTINGTDVSTAVSREFCLSLRKGGLLPRLEVSLTAPELNYDGDADVDLSLSMAAEKVLRAAGWVRRSEVKHREIKVTIDEEKVREYVRRAVEQRKGDLA